MVPIIIKVICSPLVLVLIGVSMTLPYGLGKLEIVGARQMTSMIHGQG